MKYRFFIRLATGGHRQVILDLGDEDIISIKDAKTGGDTINMEISVEELIEEISVYLQYGKTKEHQSLSEAKEEMFGNESEFLSDDMGAQ